MSWQTPGGEPPTDPAAPTPPDPLTPRTDPSEATERIADVPTPEAPTAPAPGLISAAPVGWAAPAQPAPPPVAGGPEVSWTPPAPAARAVSMGAGLVIAGVFSRLVAYVIDLVLVGIVYFILLAAVGATYTDRLSAGAIAVGVLLLAAEAVYFIAMWRSAWHATLGMRLMGIRVLGAVDGGTLPLNSAAIRWAALVAATTLLGFIPGIGGLAGFLWALTLLLTTGTHPLRQGMHDRWAGSVVVQPAPGGSAAAVVGCIVLIAIGFALPFLLLIMLGGQIREILSAVGNSI